MSSMRFSILLRTSDKEKNFAHKLSHLCGAHRVSLVRKKQESLLLLFSSMSHSLSLISARLHVFAAFISSYRYFLLPMQFIDTRTSKLSRLFRVALINDQGFPFSFFRGCSLPSSPSYPNLLKFELSFSAFVI